MMDFYRTTWRYNPENSHLRTHRRENLKSYLLLFFFPSTLSVFATKVAEMHVISAMSVCLSNNSKTVQLIFMKC
jgi:hypothetical protein